MPQCLGQSTPIGKLDHLWVLVRGISDSVYDLIDLSWGHTMVSETGTEKVQVYYRVSREAHTLPGRGCSVVMVVLFVLLDPTQMKP